MLQLHETTWNKVEGGGGGRKPKLLVRVNVLAFFSDQIRSQDLI